MTESKLDCLEHHYWIEEEVFDCGCCGYFWIAGQPTSDTQMWVYDNTNAGEHDR